MIKTKIDTAMYITAGGRESKHRAYLPTRNKTSQLSKASSDDNHQVVEGNVIAMLSTHHKTKQRDQEKPTTGLLYADCEGLKMSIAHCLLNARTREIGGMAVVVNLDGPMDPKTIDNLERFVY